jgi:hypothetical protein
MTKKNVGPMPQTPLDQQGAERMKKVVALALIILLVVPTLAQAREKKEKWSDGFYIGIGVGGGRIDANLDTIGLDLPPPPAGTGETIESNRYTNTALTYKFFAGYRFAKVFAIEGGYINFTDSDERYCFIDDTTGECASRRFRKASDEDGNTSVVSSTQWEVSIPLNGYTFFGVGILPISERFEFFGKLGGISWNMAGASGRERVVGGLIQVEQPNPNFPEGNPQVWIGPGQRNTDVDGVDLAGGIGFNFLSETNITIRTEFEYFDIPKTNDIWFMSLSAVYNF